MNDKITLVRRILVTYTAFMLLATDPVFAAVSINSNYQESASAPLLKNIDALGPEELTSPLSKHALRRIFAEVNLAAINGTLNNTGEDVVQLDLFKEALIY